MTQQIIKWTETTTVSWILFVAAALLNGNINVTHAEFAPLGSSISLDEVTELHFHKGHDTTYSRSPPLPQLACTRGCEFQPDVVKCINIKPKGRSSRWRCETDLPSHLKINETSIICEGFYSDEDEEVLEGSCALEYTLTHYGWAPYDHTGKMSFDPKMKGWSASWIVMSAVLGYLSFHIYHGVNWIQEYKALLQRLKMAWVKAMRRIQGMQDQVLPMDPAEKSCCRFNARRKRDRNGITHDGPHCADHCPDMPGH